jgi:hypothetical protein
MENETFEMEECEGIHTKIARFLKNRLYDIAIVLLCLTRIVFGLAEIQKTGHTVAQILADGFITLVFSIVLSRLLEGKGLISGEKTTEYQEAIKNYKSQRDRIGDNITLLDEWCDKYTHKRYENKVKTLLMPYGISLKDYQENTYDKSKFNEKQLKKLNAIGKTKVKKLTTVSLMAGDLETIKEMDYDRITKKSFTRLSASSDLVLKIVLSIVWGYYTLPAIATWNWAGAIWALMHTVLIFGLSVIKYFAAYNFVNEELRAKVMDKTNKIKQFLVDINDKNKGDNEDGAN